MMNPMQFDPDRLRVALDNGEVVELDGGTLVVGADEVPSVVLRLAPWRARSVARVLEEWSGVSRVFHRAPRPILTELELSRTLDLAASALGDPEPTMPILRGDRVVPSRQRLDAVAVLAERESRLSALQRLALVDAAASWLSEPDGGTPAPASRAENRHLRRCRAPAGGPVHHRVTTPKPYKCPRKKPPERCGRAVAGCSAPSGAPPSKRADQEGGGPHRNRRGPFSRSG